MSELRAIEEEMIRHEDPIVTVPELAERVDASDTHVRDLLRLLEREGAVGRKDTGARATAWWHERRVTPPRLPPDEHPDQAALDESASASTHTGEATALEYEQLDDQDVATREGTSVEDAVENVDVPGQGQKEEDRLDALRGVLMHLRDGGEATAGELRDLAFEHHETHYESARSFWKNCGSEALADLREQGYVELADKSRGVWRWSA